MYCFHESDPDSRPPPVSFSPPKAPPISAPLVPMFTLAMPQSEPEPVVLRNRSLARMDSVKIAASRGGERLKGSAVASDAFFPFRDGLDAAAAAGARCVVQPGGSVRDAELIAAADEHDLAMLFTSVRHFRH